LSHRRVILSRGTHQKSLVRGRGAQPSKTPFFRYHRTCPVNPPDSRNSGPDSRGSHHCMVNGWLPETFRQTLERFTGLVQWPFWTCPVYDLITALFEVGAINRSPPTPLGCWPLRKMRTLFEIQSLSSFRSL
jgi:hypothetical protein